MASVPARPTPPAPEEIHRIAAIANPIVRNLRITLCYHRLSTAIAARTGLCANWCTFATWASKQAGATIRGEDMLEALTKNTLTGSVLAHPIQNLWRWLLRRGLLNPATRLGRLVAVIHSPFDALERASQSVASGNLKVFEEIGFEFARYLQSCPADATVESEAFQRFATGLKPGPPPVGQEYLRTAFSRLQRQSSAPDEHLRAAWIFTANAEIGMHEQTRLQPEINAALEAVPATADDLGERCLDALFPKSFRWNRIVRRALVTVFGRVALAFARASREITRRFITRSLMTLAIPGTTLALGKDLDRPPASVLREVSDADCLALLSRFGRAEDGAEDWGNLEQRMSFIVHLFRSFHDCTDLLNSPFTAEQVRAVEQDRIPEGRL